MKRMLALALCIFIPGILVFSACSDRSDFAKPEKKVFTEEERQKLDEALAEINKEYPETAGIEADWLVPSIVYDSNLITGKEYAVYRFTYYCGEFRTKASWSFKVTKKDGVTTETELGCSSENYGSDEIFNFRMTEKDVQKYKDELYREIQKKAGAREKLTGGKLDIPDAETLWENNSPHCFAKTDKKGNFEYYLGFQFFPNYIDPAPDGYTYEDVNVGVKIKIRRAG